MNLNNQEESLASKPRYNNSNNNCLLPDLKITHYKPKRSFKIPQKFLLLKRERERLDNFLQKKSNLPPVNIINAKKKKEEKLKRTQDENDEKIIDTARKFNYTVLKNIEMNDALRFEKVHSNKGNS